MAGRKRKAALMIAVIPAMVAGGCAHRPPVPAVPVLRAGSAEDVGPRLSNYSEATLPRNGTIVIRSDDFVGASAPVVTGKKQKAVLTTSLAAALAKVTGLQVMDQSKPFETLDAANARLAGAPVGNLLVICYGFGDAAKPSKTDFRAGLEAMIRAAHAGGDAVYLVVEPATKRPLSAAVEPYRNIDRAVAGAEGAGLIDSPAILQKAGLGPSVTAIQPKAAVDIIAGNLAAYIKLAPKSEP